MEKYTTASIISKITDAGAKKEEEKKTIITDDTYALVEMLGYLLNKIGRRN